MIGLKDVSCGSKLNFTDPVYSIKRNNRNFSMSSCVLLVAKLLFCFYMSSFFSVISEVFSLCWFSLLLQSCRATLTWGKHESKLCSIIQELHGNLQLIITIVLSQFCANVIPDLWFEVRCNVWEEDKSSLFSHVLPYRLCTLKNKWSQPKDLVLKTHIVLSFIGSGRFWEPGFKCCTSDVMKRIWFSYNGNCMDATFRFSGGK